MFDNPDMTGVRVVFAAAAILLMAVAWVIEIIELGWIPGFWSDDTEIDEPVCPSCAEHRLDFSDDGPVLKPRDQWTA